MNSIKIRFVIELIILLVSVAVMIVKHHPVNKREKIALSGSIIVAIATFAEYYVAAEPSVRCGESHHSGQTEPPCY